MSMTRNVVDLVDFDFHCQRRPKIIDICVLKSWWTRLTYILLQNLDMYMSRNVVDLVDFDFHNQKRPKILDICMSKNLVD